MLSWWIVHVAFLWLVCSSVTALPDNTKAPMSRISYVMGNRLVYLAEYLFMEGESFRIDLVVDMDLSRSSSDPSQDHSTMIDAKQWNSIQTRTMLHLVACNPEAVAFLDSVENPSLPKELPSYCALENGTIGDLCLSFPLTRVDFGTSKDKIKYHVNQTIQHKLHDPVHNESQYLVFFLDACETIGGKYGALRSCLNQDNSQLMPATTKQSQKNNCFHCSLLDQSFESAISDSMTNNDTPKEKDKCTEPPFFNNVPIHISYRTSFDEDASDGDSSEVDEPTITPIFTRDSMLGGLYLCFALIWLACLMLWLSQLRSNRSHRIDLQKRMQVIPMAEVVYTVMMSFASFKWVGMTNYVQSVVVFVICVSRLLSIGIFVELVLLISRGWQITRSILCQWEYGVCQVLSMSYAFCYVVVQYNLDQGLIVGIMWVCCWFLLGAMMIYESRKRVQLLTAQLGLARQLGVNPQTTPASTKLQLFGRVFVLFTVYLTISPVILMVRSRFHNLGVLVEETFTLVIYGFFGHTFRCREFHHSFDLLNPPTHPRPMPPRQNWFHANSFSARRDSTVSSSQIAPEVPLNDKKQSNDMVVIVNPDQEAVLGKSFVVERPKKTGKRFKKTKKYRFVTRTNRR